MTFQRRSASLPSESIFMAKESFLSRWFKLPWSVTAANGQFGNGNPEESLNSQRSSIRPILTCTRFFSLWLGRSPTAHSTSREVQRFMFAFGRTKKGNFTLFTSKNAIATSNLRITHKYDAKYHSARA